MKGETLIEVLIALTVAVVVITSIAVLGVSSLSNSQFIKSQSQAGKYAQEGIEAMRAIRNNDYVGYRNYVGKYCFGAGQLTLGAPQSACTTPNIDNIYVRSVQINQGTGVSGDCAVNSARTIVTVAWTDGKCKNGALCHSSVVTSCFSTVQPIPAP